MGYNVSVGPLSVFIAGKAGSRTRYGLLAALTGRVVQPWGDAVASFRDGILRRVHLYRRSPAAGTVRLRRHGGVVVLFHGGFGLAVIYGLMIPGLRHPRGR